MGAGSFLGGDSRAWNENSEEVETTEGRVDEPVSLRGNWSPTPWGVPEESFRSASELSHQGAGMPGIGFANSFHLLAKGAWGGGGGEPPPHLHFLGCV